MAGKETAKEKLERLNAERAVIQIRGRVKILGWEESELHKSVKVPVFSTVAEMRAFYANQFVTVQSKNPDGEVEKKKKPLFNTWLAHPDRPTYTGVTFQARPKRFVDGRLNLWNGFGVTPAKGDCDLFLEHLHEVICAGDKAHADYLVKWIAWGFQNPTKQAEVAIVLHGKKGTGKGEFARALWQCYGSHAIHVSDRKHVIGSFNSHFLQCAFLYLDEALWPGDKDAEGPLKRLITEPTLFVEPKGIDAFEVSNCLKVLMTGNESWMVPASSDERRYAVFEVSDKHLNDFEYFRALRKELDEGGLASLLESCLAWDLGDWHPRQDIPQTQGLAHQKMLSATPQELWLGGILAEGVLPLQMRDQSGTILRIVHKDDPSRARTQLLWKHAVKSDPKLRYWSEPEYWRFLDAEGILKAKRNGEGSWRQFPQLSEARATWSRRRSWWSAFEEGPSEWQFAHEEGENVHVPAAAMAESADRSAGKFPF